MSHFQQWKLCSFKIYSEGKDDFEELHRPNGLHKLTQNIQSTIWHCGEVG